MGLEGLVSKRADRPYRGGRSPHWIKVKIGNTTPLTAPRSPRAGDMPDELFLRRTVIGGETAPGDY
jgi:hypothetical protein